MKLMNKKGKPDAISLPNTSGLCYVAIELTKTIRVVSDAIVLPVTTGIAIFGIKMAPKSFDVFQETERESYRQFNVCDIFGDLDFDMYGIPILEIGQDKDKRGRPINCRGYLLNENEDILNN